MKYPYFNGNHFSLKPHLLDNQFFDYFLALFNMYFAFLKIPKNFEGVSKLGRNYPQNTGTVLFYYNWATKS